MPAKQGTEDRPVDAGALDGRRIVVTRALEQARDLTMQLTALGATVISLPAISFADPVDRSLLDGAIAELHGFDWVLFTSANAVRFFARRCRMLGIAPHAAQANGELPFVAAVGPATSEAAAAEGFLVAHMAEEFQGRALGRELAEELAGKKVLLPHGNLAGSELPDALRAAGAEVTEVICYRTLEAASAAPEALEAVRRGAADVVTFFSGSAFRSLLGILGKECLGRVAIAAIAPVTAAEIRAAGLSVVIDAPEATTKAFVAALVRYFAGG